MQLQNAINWFEVPVSDFDRAKKFYETIFNFTMPESQMGPARMGFFLYDMAAGKVGGAIVHHPNFYSPADNGTLVYLNGDPDLQLILNRVTAAGGTILNQKEEISPEQDMGFWATIKDTEGNRIALHSMG